MPNDTEVHLVYVTTETRNEALSLARTLVNERLAACANLLGEITSVFQWDGGVKEAAEQGLLLKTSGSRLAALTARIKALHSYDCPCVVALPVAGGNVDFLNWVNAETA
ncbi:MAG: divalent-cation tolerance protein CutA [Magnetovibrionaceae bacterium]